MVSEIRKISYQVIVKISKKIWSTGDSGVLRIADQVLAILVSFDLQTGTNFVYCSQTHEITQLQDTYGASSDCKWTADLTDKLGLLGPVGNPSQI